MGSIVRFSAVNTKIKSMEGKLLSKEQYIGLMECKSYEDAIRYLEEETSYSSVLSGMSKEVHRGQLEIMLKREYIKKFFKLSHYFNSNYKKLLNLLFMRYEIEDLKVMLRSKYVGKDNDEIRSLLFAQSPMSTIDYDKLIASKDIPELIDNLYGTEYHKELFPLISSAKKDGLFRMESALDFLYFNSLKKFHKKIDKKDAEILHEIVGTYSDLFNIQWVIRGRMYYNLSPEELLNYTISDGYKLKKETIKNLCYVKDNSEIYEALKDMPYKAVFKAENNDEYFREREILVYLKKIFKAYERLNSMDISGVIVYLELLFLEVRDIISIVENIRYGVGFEETSKYITSSI